MSAFDPGVDVVVVNYQTPHDLRGFLQSFARVQFEVPSTLYIVNVEPTSADEAAVDEELEDIKVPIGYAVCPSNIGYAKACNQAAKAVEEFNKPRTTIAFFNADTRLEDGVLDHCHWNLHLNKEWGIVGPRQVNDSGKITHAGIFGTNEEPKLRGWLEKDKGQYNEIRDDAVSVAGSAYFVKRECWNDLTECPEYRSAVPDAVGAFLPTPHYYEETFASYHAREHGWKVAYDGEVSMIHRWHKASPVGGVAERKFMPTSRKMFRETCDAMGIAHD